MSIVEFVLSVRMSLKFLDEFKILCLLDQTETSGSPRISLFSHRI